VFKVKEALNISKVLKSQFEYECGGALHTAYADLYMQFNFMSFRFLLYILNM
jgi:hypothetical protein